MHTRSLDTRPEVERGLIGLGDPLGELARKERRALMGLSMIALAMAWTRTVPTRLSALGLEFQPLDIARLLLLFFAVLLYFLFTFLLYATGDVVAGRWGRLWQSRGLAPETVKEFAQQFTPSMRYRVGLTTLRVTRGVSDVVLPLLLGIAAIYAVLSWALEVFAGL